MPIVSLLREAAFDPETTHILTTAFNKAWDNFKSSGSALADGAWSHSVSSSALLSSDAGMVRPSILAVFALMTNSTLVDTHPSGSLRSSLRLRISNR
jgi:hypothetical protein